MSFNVRNISIISIGTAILIAAAAFFYLLRPAAPGETNMLSFRISSGAGFEEIISGLKSARLIRSSGAFRIYSILTDRAHVLKPGDYELSPGFSAPRIVHLLAAGPQDVLLTIAPGMTLAEIDDRLSSAGIIVPGALKRFSAETLKSDYPWLTLPVLTKLASSAKINLNEKSKLEGFLFPDTYYFSPQSDVKVVVQKILNNFEAKALPIFGKDDNLPQALILASLLEKETPDFGEKRIVAGILKKRLAAGMPLQVDATVVYAKCAGTYIGCPALKPADFKIDSPYNTYLYNTLPPGPVSNPGLESIRAALSPEQSAYWYYLSDPKTKKTIFAKTLDEHNENRSRYLLSN